MNKKRVLVIGAYGTVGSVISEIIAKDERIVLVIAGRNESRAKELAHKLRTELRTIDINSAESITSALSDISVIINCFSGPFTHAPLLLPEMSATSGIHYMDVSGSYEYAERFLQLNELAAKNNVTLITALGANPGIPGIALMSAKDDFETLESGRILFVLGAKLDGVSASSLKELKHMFDVKPLIWKKPQWVKPNVSGCKEYIKKPFDKDVYLGVSVTRDLLAIPELVNMDELSFWSGSQNTCQGLVMIVGLKLGLTGSDWGARLLLDLLKQMGKTRQSVSDALIKVEVTGKKQGIRYKRIMTMYCDENYATALAPSIVCQQLIEKKIASHGAFVPPQIVPAADFMDRLGKFAIHYSVTTEGD
jgi:hypothetical protein